MVILGFKRKLLHSALVNTWVRCMSNQTTKSEVIFRNLKLDEATKVCEFGKQELARTFKHLYNDDDWDQYILEAYSPKTYCDWITSKDYLVYGAFLDPVKTKSEAKLSDAQPVNDEVLVAYILAGPCNLPLSIPDNSDPGEIKRLYAHPSTFGSGISEQLLKNAMTWLRSGIEHNKRNIYLGVYSDNPRAIKFYEKHNFHVNGEYIFKVGNHGDKEFIMKNTI